MGIRAKGRHRIYPPLLVLLLTLSIFGFSFSLWAHLETLVGHDPSVRFKAFSIFQSILFALLVPVMFELFLTRKPCRVLRSPRWMRMLINIFLVYYAGNFYVFLYWSVDHLSSCATWRMFSSGWLLLFSLTAVYYRVRFTESK